MQLNRNIILALGVGGAVILWLITGMFGDDSSSTPPASEEALPPQHAIKVVSQTFTPTPYVQTINTVGHTEANTLATVAAQTAGNVTNINVNRGDTVQKDTVLLSIDKASRKAAVDATQADLEATQAEYNVAQELNREGLVSDTTLAVRKAALTLAKERAELAREDLAHTSVKAPITGRIEEKMVDVGDYVNVGTPLFTILDQNKYLLVAYVAQTHQKDVTTGQIAKATLANGDKIEGRVSFVAQHANAETKTYRVDIEVDGHTFNLPLGMTADISIPIADVQAINVPHSALVLNDEGTLGVMTIAEDDTAQFMPATILQDAANGVWINATGLSAPIVTRGQGALTAGAHVTNDVLTPDAE